MLNLSLRPEFRGKKLQGTVIELRDSKRHGAIERPSKDFLDITYPSIDLLKMVEALQPEQTRTIVLKGGRGQGKSHMMATAYHLLSNHGAAEEWRDYWANRLQQPAIANLKFRQGFHIIAEAMHNQRYKFLWDLLWEQHPHGQFVKGQWSQRGTSVPSDEDILTLVSHTPTVLILDEFQTWFDGLTDAKQNPHKNWAFNFIQTLSEVANSHPDKLALIVSVRDGDTDAYKQLHRVSPVVLDFTGPLVKRDRRRLLLYRIFENRFTIPDDQILQCLEVHFNESCRIRQISPTDIDKERQEFLDAWPYSPRLLQILDDQVLVATEAQETRDLIKLLVETFKVAGDAHPVLTSADFRIDDDRSAVGSLIDSVANQVHRDLREKALRNLENIKESVPNPAHDVPHASEIISALWLRSLTVDRLTGAHPQELQIDITRHRPIDENAFRVELSRIREGSFNIHEMGERLVFKNEENNETKLLASARNARLFANGEDTNFLAKIIHSVLAGTDTSPFRIIVLRKNWEHDPWSELPLEAQPSAWNDNRIPVLVLPEFPLERSKTLGGWLARHLTHKRNTVRFLMPPEGSTNVYVDQDLVIDARAAKLASDWKSTDREFVALQTKFERDLTTKLKARFTTFAILDRWDYANASHCEFAFDRHNKVGSNIPTGIQTAIKEDLFIPEDFEALVLAMAASQSTLADLLKELQEPMSGGGHSIPWLGENEIKENIEYLVARGKIAVNLRGSSWLQSDTSSSEAESLGRVRGRVVAITGNHLSQTTLSLPHAVPSTAGSVSASFGEPARANEPTAPPTNAASNPFSTPPPGGLFGGGLPAGVPGNPPDSSPPSITRATRSLTSSANSPLNLLGTVEQWGISSQTRVASVHLSIEGLTGAQLQSLLQRLPGGKYVLEVETEDD